MKIAQKDNTLDKKNTPTPCNFSMHVAGAAKGGKIDCTVFTHYIFLCIVSF